MNTSGFSNSGEIILCTAIIATSQLHTIGEHIFDIHPGLMSFFYIFI